MHDPDQRRGFPWPALMLFPLSPVVGELLSGASPPVEFFTVFGLTVMGVLYGCGALLVRELAFRWGSGWPGRLLLGAAYGIIEEGLMVKSFFDPGWPDLGVLAGYGRGLGVNWVWSLELTLYHCLFSIAIPILLTELMFPRWRGRRWLGPPGLLVVGAMFTAVVVHGFGWLAPYRPPVVPHLGALLAVSGLVVAAWRVRLPAGPIGSVARITGLRELPFFLLGAGGTLLFFGLNWWLPAAGFVAAPVTMVLAAWLVAGVLLGLRELASAFGWTGVNQWALASGALAFFVLFAQVAELDGNRTDDPRGMGIVGLIAAALLLAGFLWMRARDAAGARKVDSPPAAG